MKFIQYLFLTVLMSSICSGLVNAQQTEAKDGDRDGIYDTQDKCPKSKGVPRYQGCPVPDEDKDGIDDETDKCPTIKGVVSNEGCPALKKAHLLDVKLAADAIVFAPGSINVPSKAFVPLNKVAKILNENPPYKLLISVRIDDAAASERAKNLSQNRADSIAAYLDGQGVLDRQILARMFDTERRKANSKPLESTSKVMVELKLIGYNQQP